MKRLLYVVLLLAGATLVPLAPASAAACSGTSGVTVVVQFPDHTEVGCAAGDPSSGFAALSGAGFHVTVVTRFPGAVCQINSYPDTACENMPPANAYWTYYQASRGGSWTKSNYGAASTNPKPGSFEGWRFGDGTSEPSYDIPAAATPTAKPTSRPTTKHPSAPGSTAPTGSSHVAAPGSTPTAPDASATPTHASTSKPTASASASDTVATVPQTTTDAGRAAAYKKESSPSGGNQSWIWGVVLVAVLGTAGAATAARRRRG